MKLKKIKLNKVLLEKKEMKNLVGSGIYKCGCGCGEFNGVTNASDSASDVFKKN